jgi:hypothetical protein
MKFTDSKHCASRQHCAACRSSRAFRLSLAEAFELPEGGVDFTCPHGQGDAAVEMTPAPATPKRCGCSKRKVRRGLGDMVAAVTTAVGMERCGGCKRRQVRLNRFGCRINHWLHRVVDWLVPCGLIPKQ